MPAIKDFQGLRTREIRNLVKHDHLTAEELDRLVTVRAAGTIEVIAASPLLSESTQRTLAVSGRDGVVKALARNPAVTEFVQQILLREGAKSIDLALMGNPNLVPSVADRLIHWRGDQLQELARNPSLGKKQQRRLLAKADGDASVLRALAGNPSIHGSVQKRLPFEDATVATALAGNPSLTSRSQCRLYLHESWEVLEVLAGNPSLSARLQKGLAEKAGVGSRSTVRRTVDLSIGCSLASNPTFDPAQVEALLGEDDRNVDRVLAKNPAVRPAGQQVLYQRASASSRAVLLEACPRLDPAIQRRALGGTTHEHVNLARNPNLDPEAAQELSRSEEPYVLSTLAQNPSLPQEVQHRLSAHPDPEVRAQLLVNPRLELDDSYDCSFLAAGDRTSAYLLERTREYDPAVRAVMVPDFAGTVTELRAVLDAFVA